MGDFQGPTVNLPKGESNMKSTLQASVWSCSLDNSVEKTSMWLGWNECLQVKIGWANAENGPLYTIWHEILGGSGLNCGNEHVMGKSISGCDNWRFYHRPFWIGTGNQSQIRRDSPNQHGSMIFKTQHVGTHSCCCTHINLLTPFMSCHFKNNLHFGFLMNLGLTQFWSYTSLLLFQSETKPNPKNDTDLQTSFWYSEYHH